MEIKVVGHWKQSCPLIQNNKRECVFFCFFSLRVRALEELSLINADHSFYSLLYTKEGYRDVCARAEVLVVKSPFHEHRVNSGWLWLISVQKHRTVAARIQKFNNNAKMALW